MDESVSKVDESIKYLQEMPDWKGNTAFRDRALDLFALYKEFLSKDYRDMLEAKKDGQITPIDCVSPPPKNWPNFREWVIHFSLY